MKTWEKGPISQINLVLSELVDETSHDSIRQKLLEVISTATGFEYAILAEMEPDDSFMQITAVFFSKGLEKKVEDLLGFALVGYRFSIDKHSALKTPPIEEFTHFSDFYPNISRNIGTQLSKILGVKKIISVRQQTSEEYLGAVTFASTTGEIDLELLEYLCNNHLVYAVRLMHEQMRRANIRETYTYELESRVLERTEELKTALEKARTTEEHITEMYMDLARTREEAEIRLEETESLLKGIEVLTHSYEVQEMYSGMLSMLKSLLHYQEAFILVLDETQEPQILHSTDPSFLEFNWSQEFFGRYLEGKIRAVYDTSFFPGWTNEPLTIHENIVSALLIPVHTNRRQALLICTHPERGFFTKKHTKLAKRFSILAIQALRNAELLVDLEDDRYRLERMVEERTQSLVESNIELQDEIEVRKQAEEALRESNNTTRTFLENASEGVGFVDSKGRIIQVNKKIQKLFGYEREELIGQSIERLIPERFQNEHRKNLENYFTAPHNRPMGKGLNIIGLHKDGSEFPVDISLSYLIKEDGVNAMFFVMDITERRKAEEAIRDSENRYRSLFERTNDAVFFISIGEKIISANQQAAEMLGYELEEMIGLQYVEILAKSALSDTKADIKKLIQGEILPVHTREFCKKDGNEFPVEINIALAKDADGNPLHLQSIVRDITRRIESERKIASLAKFPSENPDPVVRLTKDGVLLYANDAARNLPLEEKLVVGKRVPDFLLEHIGSVFNSGQRNVIECEIEDQMYSIGIAPILDLGYLNLYWKNVTDERQVERLKAEFIANVSHELRTPLASILGYTEILLDGDTGELNSIQNDFLQIIFNSSENLHQLVNDLLDVTKMESGRFTLNFEQIEVVSLINKSIDQIMPIAEQKSLNLDVKLTPGLPPIQADPKRLEQVLINLLSNAVKFTQGSGWIKVSAEEMDNNHIKIQVIDTGVGIEQDDIDKLFSRFYRAKNVAGKGIGGTGLGLYISKSIIEGHNGSINVYSEADQGSTFEIILPLSPEIEEGRRAA